MTENSKSSSVMDNVLKFVLIIVLITAGGVAIITMLNFNKVMMDEAAAKRSDPVSILLTDEPSSNQASSAVTLVPATAQAQPTAMPVVTMAVSAEEVAATLPLYENEGGIPYEGTSWSVDVAPDEVEVLTGGPAEIAGVKLPGGVDRGSIIILLPDEGGKVVVRYTVTGLLAGSNWHGAYRPILDPGLIWQSIADKTIADMQIAPNCSHGVGCNIIDVLVINQSGVVKQWTVNK